MSTSVPTPVSTSRAKRFLTQDRLLPLAIVLIIIYAISTWWRTKSEIERGESEAGEGFTMVRQNGYGNGNGIQYKTCDRPVLHKVEKDVMIESGMLPARGDSFDVFIPCGYTLAQDELDQNAHFTGRKGATIMTISGLDNFASKAALWQAIKNKYGRLRALTFVPNTWLTYDENELSEFAIFANKNPNKLYIAKKNVQRQEGLKIFSNKYDAMGAFADGYVVIQEVVGDPYKVLSHKINLRLYFLIICVGGKRLAYVYNDGFVYYSKSPYRDGNTADEIITTGYRDRSVYDRGPLTLKDFLVYLDRTEGPQTSKRFFANAVYSLKGVFDAVKGKICGGDPSIKYCQLYGVDVQPNSSLNSVLVIEFNKGPSLTSMSPRDEEVKRNMIRDMYKTIGLAMKSSESPNGFNLISVEE